MEEFLFAEPMVAEVVSVIRREDDQCVLETSGPFKKLEKDPELIVDLFDQPHVSRNDCFSDLVT